MISISFQGFSRDIEIANVLKKACKAALSKNKGDVSIVVCDDDFIHAMNLEYRNVDHPTDVLSFSSDELDPETQRHYLGDIIIDLQRAQIQAAEANHLLEDELALLAVHGTLHLLGYDHDNESKKQEMWKRQELILYSLNIQMDKFSGDE